MTNVTEMIHHILARLDDIKRSKDYPTEVWAGFEEFVRTITLMANSLEETVGTNLITLYDLKLDREFLENNEINFSLYLKADKVGDGAATFGTHRFVNQIVVKIPGERAEDRHNAFLSGLGDAYRAFLYEIHHTPEAYRQEKLDKRQEEVEKIRIDEIEHNRSMASSNLNTNMKNTTWIIAGTISAALASLVAAGIAYWAVTIQQGVLIEMKSSNEFSWHQHTSNSHSLKHFDEDQ